MSALRVVAIGAGANIFSSHRRGLKAIGAEVVGVYDVNEERARAIGLELGCPTHPDVATLLAEPADLAIILAPHPFHAELAAASLRAGKHVLVEKPLAVEVAEADEMISEAERSGRTLAVAFQQRTRTEIQEARRLIQSGALGTIQRADVLGNWPRRAAYFRTAPWRGSWRGEGGGVLINQGQHDLDLLCYLAGKPRRVVGWTRTRTHSIETEDSVAAMLEWPNGALGAVRISTTEVDEPQRIEITGTTGRLRVRPGRLERWSNAVDFATYTASEGNPYASPTTHEEPPFTGGDGNHEALYRNLAQALVGDEPLIASGRDAAVTLEVANAIIYSSHTGSQVELPLDRAAYGNLLQTLQRIGQP